MEKDNWWGGGVDMWGFFEAGEGCHLKWSLVRGGPARVGWASLAVACRRAALPESHVGRASRGQLAWYPWNSKEVSGASADRVRQRVKRDAGRRPRMRCRSLRVGVGRLTPWRARCERFRPCSSYPWSSHSQYRNQLAVCQYYFVYRNRQWAPNICWLLVWSLGDHCPEFDFFFQWNENSREGFEWRGVRSFDCRFKRLLLPALTPLPVKGWWGWKGRVTINQGRTTTAEQLRGREHPCSGFGPVEFGRPGGDVDDAVGIWTRCSGSSPCWTSMWHVRSWGWISKAA